MIILKYNGVLLVKVNTLKTAFGKRNIYFTRPIYTPAGMSGMIYLQVINVSREMRIIINIIAREPGNESFSRQVATAQFQADISFHFKEIIVFFPAIEI